MMTTPIRNTLYAAASAMVCLLILLHFDDLRALTGRPRWNQAERSMPIGQLYFTMTGQHPGFVAGWTASVQTTAVTPDKLIRVTLDLGDGIGVTATGSEALSYAPGDQVRVWGRFEGDQIAVTDMTPLAGPEP